MKDIDVAVIGCAGIDTLIYMNGDDFRNDREGAAADVRDCLAHGGGYAARGYAALGYRTAFIGFVGDDFPGRHIRDVFEAEGIDCSCLWTDSAGTDRSVNFVFEDGSRRNNYNGKAHRFTEEHYDAALSLLKRTKLVHVHMPSWSRRLLKPARERGCALLCDIQDYHRDNREHRREYIEQADYLFFSAADAGDTESAMEELWTMSPCSLAVAGMGGKGCLVKTESFRKIREPLSIGLAVEDTNGAGDSLALGTGSGLCLEGLDVDRAITRGLLCAAKTCSLKATSSGMMTREELNRLTPGN